jgi:hypoxanthine phosphoribosyltransferase
MSSKPENESKAISDAATLAKAPSQWANNIESVLFSEEQIAQRVTELAAEISKDYAKVAESSPVLCVGLLNGAFIFAADIMRKLQVPYETDFIVASSYGKAATSSGSIKLKKDMSIDPFGRHVLIIEDLIDSGNTLAWIVNHMKSKGCASVKLCTLLDKAPRRTVDVPLDYVGWVVPDEFIIGYGMDFAEQYRCLPFVGVLKKSAYS